MKILIVMILVIFSTCCYALDYQTIKSQTDSKGTTAQRQAYHNSLKGKTISDVGTVRDVQQHFLDKSKYKILLDVGSSKGPPAIYFEGIPEDIALSFHKGDLVEVNDPITNVVYTFSSPSIFIKY